VNVPASPLKGIGFHNRTWNAKSHDEHTTRFDPSWPYDVLTSHAVVSRAEPKAVVSTVAALQSALLSDTPTIEIVGLLTDVPTLSLAPGQSLIGATDDAGLLMQRASEGVLLSSSNALRGLVLKAEPEQSCIRMSDRVVDSRRGVLELADLNVTGQIQLLFDDATAFADVRISDVHVRQANLGARFEYRGLDRQSYTQGAITVWNRARRKSKVRLTLDQVSIGSHDEPGVLGSGIFIAGDAEREGGTVQLAPARLGSIYIDSLPGADHRSPVCGGVLILPGVTANQIHCAGRQQSRGFNASPLINVGHVGSWLVDGDVDSQGTNSTAIMNAGRLDTLEIIGRVDTHGDGALGCAIYGPMEALRMRALCTRGIAAPGIHVCERLNHLSVSEGIQIQGCGGSVIIRGRRQRIEADGIHVALGGRLGEIVIPYIALSDLSAKGVRRDYIAAADYVSNFNPRPN
jgi:hypothetical protein